MKEQSLQLINMPEAVSTALGDSQVTLLAASPSEVKAFNRALNRLLWHGTESGTPEEQALHRTHAQQWALRQLEVLSLDPDQSLSPLRIVLTTLYIASPSASEAAQIVPQALSHANFIKGLVTLVEESSPDIRMISRHQSQQELREALQTADRDANYHRLRHLTRHQEADIAPDACVAILLLTAFAPAEVSRLIQEKRDVLFSFAVQRLLGSQSVQLALSVNNVTFKYFSVCSLADCPAAQVPEATVADIATLHVQVAQTERWRGWIMDLARYPHEDTVTEMALPIALAQLNAMHWAAFIDAVELWTLPSTANAVARLLVPFIQTKGVEDSREMWRLAFTRWDNWDYGHKEAGTGLTAPSTCSFDFPVAVYYASLPEVEIKAEIEKLQVEIACVEQTWFPAKSSLLNERNRLSSRVRLVKHALTLLHPPSEGLHALPPAINPESEFAGVRYEFYDAHAR
ncbi:MULTISPECIES: hypothetical protein [Pseudomonas]|jgi:hypothetical protein|uniref:hypothetical protein n=3 Tax=Pseudomonas TaxID=286 RepID=UPI000357FC40|nr:MULTISPECIES: hypothetical protein [Pseudomonas]OKP64682.1 hypothetical protein BTR19_31100 [Pseudomonas fluorescens]EPJ88564.1 hypothetical protein CFT9_04166 [Pseudomonas sp. CFT9]EPL07955.1 hypothetical protein CF150_23123 [Pseudomonas sp. CF150]MCF5511680.1 hypothetical protein [Pseudomonas sp. PA-3-6H]MCF5565046.1 hypothetical protein [Pseudomonas sp. PA-3-5D]